MDSLDKAEAGRVLREFVIDAVRVSVDEETHAVTKTITAETPRDLFDVLERDLARRGFAIVRER